MKAANPTETEVATQAARLRRLATRRKSTLKAAAQMRNWSVCMSVLFHLLTAVNIYVFWLSLNPLGAIMSALMGYQSVYFILEYRKHRDSCREIKAGEWDDTLLDTEL
jgi:hypothetical protein